MSEEKKQSKDLPVQEDSKDSLKELVEKNIKWSQVIYEQNRKIKHRLTIMVIANYLRLLIIVVPIILAAIYLPPLFKDLWGQYGEIFGISGGAIGNIGQLESIISQIPAGQLEQIFNMLGK